MKTNHANETGVFTQFIILGIFVCMVLWASLWFWPLLGNINGTYSGIDYLLSGEDAVAGPFFAGTFLLLVSTAAGVSILLK